MDLIALCKAIILGLVEGVTEFLPISSTGHLIVVGAWLDFDPQVGRIFNVVIQFGAIVAICWQYRRRLGAVLVGLSHDRSARRFALNVVVACIPAVLLGLMFAGRIKQYLFAPVPVAVALIVGGMVMLWAEARERRRTVPAPIQSIDQLRIGDAFKIGMAQCLALIPGTSRSGATIIGGMLFGAQRKVATEFSFFLAIPIVFGATVHDLVGARGHLQVNDVGMMLAGAIAACISAFICVRWLLNYLSAHDFTAFAWYRIGFGLVILLTGFNEFGSSAWQSGDA
jgi:undecaprenyl-diphosphatase